MKKQYFGFFCFLLLSSCSDKDAYKERPAKELYDKAIGSLNNNDFSKAAKDFLEVERQHPYSDLALKSQIFSAYCFYQVKKYDDAIDGFTIFAKLHPSHKDVAYAYYMIGICYYEQIPVIERDQKVTELALKYFEDLCNRFKDSKYALDAKFKIVFLKEHLAAKNMYLGRFYQKSSNPIAAMKYFQNVTNNYQTTSHIEEALYRCIECYLTLNITEEAQRTAAVLYHNYPKGYWYKKAYNLIKKRNQ